MNKIQKILWSIFSGMICIVYRSDALTVSKTCPWTLIDSMDLGTYHCNQIKIKDGKTNYNSGCSAEVSYNNLGNQINSFLSNNNINSASVFNSSCATTSDSGIEYYKFKSQGTPYSCIDGKKSCINIDAPGGISTLSTASEFTGCGKYYFYSCDPENPSDSGCCTKCPAAIQGVSEEELFGTAPFKSLLITNDTSGVSSIVLCSDTDIYGTNIGTNTLQIYKHTTCIRAEKQNANSCVITVTSSGNHEYTAGEHSDHTGVYTYELNDECKYEKQN